VADAVRVDSDSAVVSYRPAAGEERSALATDASPRALTDAVPWRTFRWYFGQRHYSGTYWAATERDHVIYESRLELANLLLADFDQTIHRIVAQPFSLRAVVNGQMSRHVPDFLCDTDGGLVVVDVVRSERMAHPRIVLLLAWTKSIVESLGWTYLVVNEPPKIRLANVRFLSGYRREWLVNQDVLGEMCSCIGQFAGMSIADAERSVKGYPRPLIRPALMHLLWRHAYLVNLDESLDPSMVLERGR